MNPEEQTQAFCPTYISFECDGEEYTCLVNRFGIFRVKEPLIQTKQIDKFHFANNNLN